MACASWLFLCAAKGPLTLLVPVSLHNHHGVSRFLISSCATWTQHPSTNMCVMLQPPRGHGSLQPPLNSCDQIRFPQVYRYKKYPSTPLHTALCLAWAESCPAPLAAPRAPVRFASGANRCISALYQGFIPSWNLICCG